ncbi:MAG: carboxypeptidase-like regulatory domain-containing protein [Thermoanaerobaculia bacterium]
MRNRGLGLLVLGLLVAVSPLWAQSQATTGVIEGIVKDESGAVLPGATVVLTNRDTNFARTVTTEANGRFRAILLPLGNYRAETSLDGFTTSVIEGIELAVGRSVQLDIGLTVAGASEQIVVTAEVPLVEATRTEGSTRIGEQAIESLPNNGRNFLDYEAHPGTSRSSRVRTARSCRSTDRRGSRTTSRWMVRTSTTRSSASSAAVSGRLSPSTSTPFRRSWSWPTALRPSSAAPPATSSTW